MRAETKTAASGLGIIYTRLICGHHVLDVDEGIFSPLLLKQGQGVTDEFSQTCVLPLAIVNAVAQVLVVVLVQVEDGQDLSIVGHQGLTH